MIINTWHFNITCVYYVYLSMTDMISMIILLHLKFHNYFRHIYEIVIKIQWHPGKTHHKRHLHIVRNSASPGFYGWHLITHPLVKLSRHAKSPSALPSGKPLVCVLFHRAQQNPAMLLVIQLHLLPCLTKNVKLRSEKCLSWWSAWRASI